MAKSIFNEHCGVDVPALVLKRRDFSKIGNIKNASNIEYKDCFGSPELSFQVYKQDNDELWENINNYNVVYISEYKEYFALHVNTNEEDITTKTVECTYLPQDELQNTKLYDIEINTEADIAREDYDADYPTIFYRDLSNYEIGSDMYKKLYNSSLLHRIMDKASNYTIDHVDTTLKNLPTWFQYSIKDSNVYDTLTGEVAKNYQCLFVFDSVNRTISAYDLCDTCSSCHYRGDFHDECPECHNENIYGSYGEDTAIYISKENLSTSASIESNKDNLKNCFYVTGGDDLMSAAVALANPNGSNYFYSFSEEMLENMPEDLVTKINEYNNNYDDYLKNKWWVVGADLSDKYNATVGDINKYYPVQDLYGNKSDRYATIGIATSGYKYLSRYILDSIDIALTLEHEMGKTMQMDSLSMEDTMALLTSANLSPVAVKSDLKSVSISVINNAILGECKSLINTGLYKVDVVDESYDNKSLWQGKIKLTSIEDNKVTLTGNTISIIVNNDMENYLKQSIQRQLNKLSTNYKDLRKIDLSDDDFIDQLNYYSKAYLEGLYESYKACSALIVDSNIEEFTTKYQTWYDNHVKYIEAEIGERDKQLESIYAVYDYENSRGKLYELQQGMINDLNFEVYLGDLWKVFCSYRMEESYQNENYISDGLNSSELVKRANELINDAKNELYKASHVQYTVTSTINNLLILPEFQKIIDKFEVGNWIHVCVDDKNYYLRLLSYKIFFDEAEKIEVEFSTVERVYSGVSDVQSVIESAKDMAGSYSYTAQKVKNNTSASTYVQNWVQKGLDATVTKIVNNADNQSVVYGIDGILCRNYDDLSDEYDDCQLKIINNGLYITKDNWKSVENGVGKIIYIDPENGKEVIDYGVIAKTVVGKLILGETLKIYNTSGSLKFNENGLDITNKKNTFIVNPNDNAGLLRIKNGNTNIFYVDNNGNLNLTGAINSGSTITGSTIKGGTIGIGGTNYNNFVVQTDGSLSINNKFEVDANGIMKATGATINGIINAIGGTFSGTINCSGTISGGTISGSNIEGGKIHVFNPEVLTDRVDIGTGSINIQSNKYYYGLLDYKNIHSEFNIGNGHLMYIVGDTTLLNTSRFDNMSNNFALEIPYIKNTLIGYNKQRCIHFIDGVSIDSDHVWINGVLHISGNTEITGALTLSNKILFDEDYYIHSGGKQLYLCVNTRDSIVLSTNDNTSIRAFRPTDTTKDESGQNAIYLGYGAYKWQALYAHNGTIETSDRNAKHDINYDLDSTNLEQIYYDFKPCTYVMNNGERTHIGAIAQDMELSVNKYGHTINDFAFLCRDQIYDESDTSHKTYKYNADGTPQYLYGLRYSEFVMLNTWQIHKTKKRVDSLEETIEELQQENAQLKQRIETLEVTI